MSKLAKIGSNNGSTSYRVVTSLANDELKVTILDGDNLYSCQVSLEDAVKFANSFETDVDSYMKTLHQQLSGATTATISVIDDHLTVYKNKNIIYFAKKVDKSNYTLKLESLLENIFAENSALQLKVDILEEEKRTVLDECTSLKALLEEKVTHNANYEKKLLSSFVLLLNEKKRRIQYLTDLIDSQIINTIPSKRKKLDHSEEAVSSVDDGQLTSHADSDLDNDAELMAEVSQRAAEQVSNDEDEDFLLRSPVDSPGGGEGATSLSLPKREPAKASTVISFDDDTEEEKVPQEEAAPTQETVVSSEAEFSTQDIFNRAYSN